MCKEIMKSDSDMKKTKPTDELNTIMAFTEWLHGKKDFILVVQNADGDNSLCIVDGNQEKITNSIANGMLQHPDLHSIVFKAATSVVKYKYKKLMEGGISFNELNKDIEDMTFPDDV